MTERAAKSGFALEAQRKVHGKYDSELAAELLNWVAATSGMNFERAGDIDNFLRVLKDGTVLCG